jgi:hypothetical protein
VIDGIGWGMSAVVVGLGSALISGSAVAAADTGDTSRPADTTSSAAAEDNAAPTATPRRSAHRGRGAPERAAANSGVREPESTPVVPDDPAPVPVAEDVKPAAAAVVSEEAEPAPPVEQTEPVAQAEPAAVVVTAPAHDPQTAAAAVATPEPTVTAAPAATSYVAPAPAPVPAPAASLFDVLTGFGSQPAGGALIATPALAAFTGQRQSAAPAAVVGTALTAAAPPDPAAPLPTNGVTGVQVGQSRLEIPGAFIGKTVPADWYFPTQVDGSVKAQGVIWLQHGFAADNSFYAALAEELAMKTNSIVVAPTLSSIPFTFSGGWLNGETTQEAAAAAFLDPNRAALIASAQEAGFTGDVDQLLGRFALAGHSAGGGFSAAVADDYLNGGSDAQDANLVGVVMFDGVSTGAFSGEFTAEVATLTAASTPIYQIAAPAQIWNAFGTTTNQRPSRPVQRRRAGGRFARRLSTGCQSVPGRGVAVGRRSGAARQYRRHVHAEHRLAQRHVRRGHSAGPAVRHLRGRQPADHHGQRRRRRAADSDRQPDHGAGLGAEVVVGLHLRSDRHPPTPEVNTGGNGITALVTPPRTNGVTGVKTGMSTLTIPSGNGYNAPAEWYFPTQADGSVQAQGVIWLQHGFLAFGGWYSDMATQLAQETNSIVVTPSIFWFDPLFSGEGEAIADMFVGSRPALNISANAAGFQGVLPEKFILSGHSAGGRLATTVGGYTVDNGSAEDLLGVVMFDGVPRDEPLATALGKLDSLGIPLYQIASPNFGSSTDELALLHPGQFIGVVIDNGKHTDSVGGSPIADFGSDLVIGASPPGGKGGRPHLRLRLDQRLLCRPWPD